MKPRLDGVQLSTQYAKPQPVALQTCSYSAQLVIGPRQTPTALPVAPLGRRLVEHASTQAKAPRRKARRCAVRPSKRHQVA